MVYYKQLKYDYIKEGALIVQTIIFSEVKWFQIPRIKK